MVATAAFVTACVFAPAPSAAPDCTTTFVGGDIVDPDAWDVAGNWDHGVPGSTDVACIPEGLTAVHDFGTHSVGSVQAGGAIQMTGGTLSVAGTTDESEIASFDQEGGTLAGAGTVRATGSFAWSGGTMTGTGTTAIGAGVTLTPADNMTLANGRTLEVQGTLDLTADRSIAHFGTYPRVHVVASGLIRKTGGTGTSTLDADMDNDGTVRSQSGTVDLSHGSGAGSSSGTFGAAGAAGTVGFTGATHVLADGARLLGGAAIAGGTVNVAGGATATAAGLVFSSGTIGGTGQLDLTGNMTWTGGTMSDAGVTRVAPLVTLTYTHLDVTLAEGRTLRNEGTFDIRIDKTIGHAGAEPLIENVGTIVKSSGAGTAVLDVPVRNDGRVHSTSGVLQLARGGGATAAAGTFGAAADLPGSVTLTGGTFGLADGAKLLDGVTVAGATVNVVNGATATAGGQNTFSSGTIGGTGRLDVAGTLTWAGGTMTGAGVTSVATTGILAQTGDSTLANGRALDVAGIYSLPADASVAASGGTPAVHVLGSGTLRRDTTSGVAQIDAPVTNDGRLEVAHGLLNLAGLTLGNTSTVAVGVAGNDPGTGYGRLEVAQTGALALHGSLDVDVDPAVMPAEGDELAILSAPKVTGCFSPITGTGDQAAPHYEVLHASAGVTLRGRAAGGSATGPCTNFPAEPEPTPPGGNEPPPNITPAPLVMRIAARRTLTIDRRHRIPVQLTCPSPSGSCTGSLEISARLDPRASRARKVVLGRKRFSLGAGKTARVPVALTKAGRRALKGRRRLKVTVRVTGRANGVPMKPLKVTRTLRVR